MHTDSLAWICARTKPKHEHIAAANLRTRLGVEVFLPRLRIERMTRRGLVRGNEPLFPCYLFVRCVIGEGLNEVKRTNGINNIVHFAGYIPLIADAVIEELKSCFNGEESLHVDDRFSPGDEVVFAEGAFTGMRALVLRTMPAGQRVQVLLDVLGRSTPVEVARSSIVKDRNSLADLVPVLAAAPRTAGATSS
jgi:transcriptional antiterminator RfaH